MGDAEGRAETRGDRLEAEGQLRLGATSRTHRRGHRDEERHRRGMGDQGWVRRDVAIV